MNRDTLRTTQDRIIKICESRDFPMDAPISDLQYGCPTAQQLKTSIWPDFVASMQSFLANFDNQ